MANDGRPTHPTEEFVERLLRRAGGLLASLTEEQGFASAVRLYVQTARRIVETDPEAGGEVSIRGVRDEGAVWLVGEDAERVWIEAQRGGVVGDLHGTALVLARVFCAIAYRHPFFDGNKRTGFLAAVLLGRDLGLPMRAIAFESVEATVIDFTAREAEDGEVADWLTRNVFMAGGKEEETTP